MISRSSPFVRFSWGKVARADVRPISLRQKILCYAALLLAPATYILAGDLASVQVASMAMGGTSGFMLRWATSRTTPMLYLLMTITTLISCAFASAADILMPVAIGTAIVGVATRLAYSNDTAKVFPVVLFAWTCALTQTESLSASMPAILAMAMTAISIGESTRERPGNATSLLRIAARLALIFSIAAPLAFGIFLAFPRGHLNLHSFDDPEGSSAGTGMSSSMTPGSISDLVQSDELAFTASFYVETVPASDLYWKVSAFDTYDGKTWTAGPALKVRRPVTQRAASHTVHYEINIPDALGHYVPLLDATTSGTVQISGGNLIPYPLFPDASGTYTQTSFDTPHKVSADVDRSGTIWSSRVPTETDTSLPTGINPKSNALATQWAEETHGNARQLVSKFRTLISKDPFRYTLHPAKWRDANGIDQFLFESRSGFCEHYSAAFVYMMRSAGVPARVVTGYQGGELDGSDVRVLSRDAHAWAEIWTDDAKWVRIDPTTFVDPSRVESATRENLERTSGWMLQLSAWLQIANSKWTSSVVRHSEMGHDNVLDRLVGDPLNRASALGKLILVLAAFSLVWRLQAKMREPADVTATRAFHLVASKIQHQAESELAFPDGSDLLALAAHGCTADTQRRLKDWLDAYQLFRYGPPQENRRALARALHRRAREFRAIGEALHSISGLSTSRG